MKMRNFGIIYVIVVLAIAGLYYFTLPDQDIFLKEKKWSDSKSAIKLDVEEELTVMYITETETRRTVLPSRDESDIVKNTDLTPIDKKETFIDHINKFKESTDNLEVKEYLDSLVGDFEEVDTRYTGAFSETSFLLRVQKIQPPLTAGMEPFIVEEYDVAKRVYMLYIDRDGRWRPAVMAEEHDGSWVMTEEMMERYIFE